MFALGEETVTCLSRKKGSLSELTELFTSELWSLVLLKQMRGCLWVSEHGAPLTNEPALLAEYCRT